MVCIGQEVKSQRKEGVFRLSTQVCADLQDHLDKTPSASISQGRESRLEKAEAHQCLRSALTP